MYRLGTLWLQNPGLTPLRLANPARRHSLWKTDSEKSIFKQAWNDMWRQPRWGFRGLSWTGARQIWYPVISSLKWRQDQQLPSLWVRWWNVWFGPRLVSPWQPGNIFIQDNIVVLLFLLHPPTLLYLLPQLACVCVCVCLQFAAGCLCLGATCVVLFGVCARCRSGQTDLSRRDVWQDVAVNLILPELNGRRCYLRESDLGLRWKGLRLTEASSHTRRELMAGQEHTPVCVCVCVFKIRFHFPYCSKSEIKKRFCFTWRCRWRRGRQETCGEAGGDAAAAALQHDGCRFDSKAWSWS